MKTASGRQNCQFVRHDGLPQHLKLVTNLIPQILDILKSPLQLDSFTSQFTVVGKKMYFRINHKAKYSEHLSVCLRRNSILFEPHLDFNEVARALRLPRAGYWVSVTPRHLADKIVTYESGQLLPELDIVGTDLATAKVQTWVAPKPDECTMFTTQDEQTAVRFVVQDCSHQLEGVCQRDAAKTATNEVRRASLESDVTAVVNLPALLETTFAGVETDVCVVPEEADVTDWVTRHGLKEPGEGLTRLMNLPASAELGLAVIELGDGFIADVQQILRLVYEMAKGQTFYNADRTVLCLCGLRSDGEESEEDTTNATVANGNDNGDGDDYPQVAVDLVLAFFTALSSLLATMAVCVPTMARILKTKKKTTKKRTPKARKRHSTPKLIERRVSFVEKSTVNTRDSAMKKHQQRDGRDEKDTYVNIKLRDFEKLKAACSRSSSSESSGGSIMPGNELEFYDPKYV
jgi:hypothetical protein